MSRIRRAWPQRGSDWAPARPALLGGVIPSLLLSLSVSILPPGAANASNAQSGTGEGKEANRPSFLVIVIDTLRRDAVSAYGKETGTTPVIDGLAAEGLLYERATSSSPWTLPSHATLLTGRGIEEHGVGLPGQAVLDERWATLAEMLDAAGYETAAFSENAIVSEVFGLLRGFEVKETTTVTADSREVMIDASAKIREWVRKRNAKRPFFAFVNLMDAHAPYSIRDQNPWLPPDTPVSAVRTRTARPELELCGGRPTREEIAIQRGLYLGDVNAADAKVGAIVRAVRAAHADQSLVTIVVADHGELFGEGQLMGHEFSVHGNLIDVPLVVHGLGAPPARITTPVGLHDLMPSMLEWAGIDSADHPSSRRSRARRSRVRMGYSARRRRRRSRRERRVRRPVRSSRRTATSTFRFPMHGKIGRGSRTRIGCVNSAPTRTVSSAGSRRSSSSHSSTSGIRNIPRAYMTCAGIRRSRVTSRNIIPN